MQKLLLFLISTSVFVSCTKNVSKISNQTSDSTTLISITGDSADFYFTYEDGNVTDVLARHDDSGYYYGDSSFAPYAHLSYDSSNYIKATNADPHYLYAYTEYFLNDDKLPKKIILHFFNNSTDIVDFFYNTQTNLLDSVHDTSNGINFTSAYMEYDGADITGVRLSINWPFSNSTFERFTNYNYDKSNSNVFKTLDPLWYIYKEPFGTYNANNNWVEINFDLFARLFSQHTITQVSSDYYNQNLNPYRIQDSLNSAGKLASEAYIDSKGENHWTTCYNYSN